MRRTHAGPRAASLRTRLQGARELVRRPWHRVLNRIDAPVLILAYHRVAVLSRDPFQLAVRPDRFRSQLRLLKARYPVLRLGDDLRQARERSVVITFDDGYGDNATEALPALEEARIPATFFVSSGYVDSGRPFWWDELASLVDGERLPRLLEQLKRVDAVTREARLDEIRRGRDRPGASPEFLESRPLTRAELERMARSPYATIGAHGIDHTRFSTLSPSAQREQMERSRDDLTRWTGVSVDAFSFPFGERRDMTKTSIRVAREVGFRRIALNVPGQVHRWTSMARLPRHVVRDWTDVRFEAELDRFWSR